MPPRLAVQRLSDTIAHELERRILEGALKPGDRLQPGAGVVLPPDSQQGRPTAVCILPIEIPLAERFDP